MVDYTRDAATGIVHIIEPVGQGEHTLCGFAYVDGGAVDSVDGEYSKGPVTCKHCIEYVIGYRAAFKNLRVR